MVETVQSIHDTLPERDNLKVLNVGFGLGIVSFLYILYLSSPASSSIGDPRSIDYFKRYQHLPHNTLSSRRILMYFDT